MRLHKVLEEGNHGEAENLIKERVNVNSEDEWGDTPLYIASFLGYVELVEELIMNGADVNIKGGARLEKEGLGLCETALHGAARRGHEEIAEMLINAGANVNAQDKNGCTPLYRACVYGHEEVVEMLLEKGAGVAIENNCKITPYNRAVWCGHDRVAKVLLKEMPKQ